MKNHEQTTDHETLLLLVQDIKSLRENDLKNIKEGQDRFHNYSKEILNRIEVQTTRHNGRMTKLEEWKSNSTGWVTGVSLCIGVIITLCVYIFNYQLGIIEAQEIKTQEILSTHINK